MKDMTFSLVMVGLVIYALYNLALIAICLSPILIIYQYKTRNRDY
jgi:hypothetical protein